MADKIWLDLEETESFMLSPSEELNKLALQAEPFQGPFDKSEIKGCCKNMLALENLAHQFEEIGTIAFSLVQHWKFLLLYRENISMLRRSKKVPIRILSELEDKAKTSSVIAEYLKERFVKMHKVSRERHNNDWLRRGRNNDDIFTKIMSKVAVTKASRIKRSGYASFFSPHLPQTLLPQLSSLHADEAGDLSEEDSEEVIPCTSIKIMRNIYLPSKTVAGFQSISYRNDFNNIKTTAILAASIVNRRVMVSHLLFPQQTGTSDECIITSTPELENYMTSNKLFHIGYVYNEPTNDVMLSSLEAHELCLLKKKVEEAFVIAISCTKIEVQYICLSAAGYKYISECTEKGLHPHNLNTPIFKEPVHLMVSGRSDIKIKDFRKRSSVVSGNTRIINAC